MKFCNLGIRREMSAVEKSAFGEFRLYWLWLLMGQLKAIPWNFG